MKSNLKRPFWILLAAAWFTGCVPPRAIWKAYPSPKDAEQFPSRAVKAGPHPFQFHNVVVPQSLGRSIKVDDGTFDKVEFRCLQDVLEEQKTTAFLVLRNDTLLYEEYFDGHDQHSRLTSFSVVKSFISALVGIAIDEGKLALTDPVTQYLPELKDKEGFGQVTIRDLLNHTSQIKESLWTVARIYYGRNAGRAYRKLSLTEHEGTRQSYGNINSQLLGSVLTKATGQSCSAYLQEKLWIPLAMESDAFWSLDHKDGQEKSFCCLNATARDFAKLGRLYLHGGNWEGKQIISESWIDQTLARDTTGGSSWGYNFSWYQGLERYGDFYALGLYKQFIYVDPEKQLVIVRLGDRLDRLEAEKVQWKRVFRQIGEQL